MQQRNLVDNLVISYSGLPYQLNLLINLVIFQVPTLSSSTEGVRERKLEHLGNHTRYVLMLNTVSFALPSPEPSLLVHLELGSTWNCPHQVDSVRMQRLNNIF